MREIEVQGGLRQGESKWKFSKSSVPKPEGTVPKANRNGYLIEKPNSFFSRDKKFRPY